jgi:hypothetical protein
MDPDKVKAWLDKFTPDARVWVAAGYFGLTFRLLQLIESKPELLNSAPFMTVATLIGGSGGLGVVGAFFFGGTRSGSDVMTAQSKALVANSTTPPPSPPAHSPPGPSGAQP